MTHTALTPDAVLPLVLAAAGADFVPAQLWPLDTALVVLDRETAEGSGIARALARMPQDRITTGQRFTGLRDSIHRLVASGALIPGGEGWDAGYAVLPGLIDQGCRMLSTLPLPEQAALRRAAQTFNEASRMLSKKSLASLPSGSARI
jgi:hypothetical protein